MTNIFQTDTNLGTGDCTRAAVASILGLEHIEQVPHFILFKEGMWFIVYKAFMGAFGWKWEGHTNNPEDLKQENSINGLFIASVPSKTHQGDVFHSVIIDLEGTVIHDPNPNKLWLNAKLDFSNPRVTFDTFKW